MMPVSVSVAVFANWLELLIRAVAYDFADFISCVMVAGLMGARSVLADDHCAESACSNVFWVRYVSSIRDLRKGCVKNAPDCTVIIRFSRGCARIFPV